MLKNKYKVSFIGITLLYIVIYVFFRSVLLAIIGNLATYILILAMFVLWIRACRYINLKKRVFNFFSLWEIFAIYILLNKQNYIETGVGLSYTTMVTVGGIITAIFLSFIKMNWQNMFLKYSKACLQVHILATIFFAIFPNIYRNTIFRIYDINTKQILELQLNNSYVPGITGNYSTNGIYMAIAVMLFGCEVFMNHRINIHTNRLWLVLSFLALILTGKRAHLIFAIFTLAVIYMFFSKEKNESKFLKIFFVGICGCVAIVLIINFVPALSVTISRFLELKNTTDITNGRYYFYAYAISWFKESPILGIGWEGFMYRFNLVNGAYVGLFEYMSAHNVYLQVLCELGIVGFVIFVSKLLQDIYYNLKKYNWRKMDKCSQKNELALAFSMHVFFILYCMTGNPLYDIEIFFPYMISLSMMYKYIRTKKIVRGM